VERLLEGDGGGAILCKVPGDVAVTDPRIDDRGLLSGDFVAVDAGHGSRKLKEVFGDVAS
jgi:hypothetical protein